MMHSTAAAAIALVLFAAPGAAQEMRFFYPEPGPSTYTVAADVPMGTGSARMDVYRPLPAVRGPVIVFSNAATGAQRSNTFYASWAKIAASRGITAVLPDIRMDNYAADLAAVIAHLAGLRSDPTIDPNAIAVYAGSGNVYRALPLVQDPKQTAIKSAVMYYGSAEVERFRLDLPLLFVRAGLDRPGVNQGISGLVSAATAQNAPVTLINNPAGYHAFEIRNDDEATREAIDRTLEFVKRTTSALYQAALQRGVLEATAAGHVISGHAKEAAATYARLVAERPENHTMRLAYAEALLADSQFAAACAEAEKLKGKGLGARDLGVPAARACMQKGDADGAIAWLASIPAQYRPASLEKDPVFEPIRTRPEFRALFAGR